MKENREELEARIAAYIDGQLPPAEAARLEVFLANTDPALAQQIIGMIAEKHAVRSLPKPAAPEDLAGRIMEQIERTSLLNDVEHFSAPRRPWWQSRGAVAAAIFLVLGGFTFFVLEAVWRRDNSWRDALMEGNSHRELAAGPSVASAPTVAALTGSAASTASVPAPPVSIATGAAIGDKNAVGGRLDESVVAPAAGAAIALDSTTQPSAADAAQSVASDAPAGVQPVVLALVARDGQDYARLRSRLEEFLAADAESGRNNTDALKKESNQAALRQAQAQNGADHVAQNNSNSNEQYAARAAPGGAMAKDDITAQYQEYNSQQRRFNTPVGNGDRSETEAKGSGLPYHVSLRAEQLQQLAQEFQVQTATRTRKAVTRDGSALQLGGENAYSNSGASGAGAAEEKSASQHLPAFDQAKEAWVDCVITMDPPAQTTATSPAPPVSPSTDLLSTPPSTPSSQPR